jgi:hypothetical protein
VPIARLFAGATQCDFVQHRHGDFTLGSDADFKPVAQDLAKGPLPEFIPLPASAPRAFRRFDYRHQQRDQLLDTAALDATRRMLNEVARGFDADGLRRSLGRARGTELVGVRAHREPELARAIAHLREILDGEGDVLDVDVDRVDEPVAGGGRKEVVDEAAICEMTFQRLKPFGGLAPPSYTTRYLFALES